jgi:uncharacterized protein (DUF849 family)
MLLQACLNGSRTRGDHPALPITPEQVAVDAAAVMRAGASCIHVHPRRHDGAESLADADISAVVSAVRNVCPGLPVGVSTAAWIEPDLQRRLSMIGAWSVLPDFASVNLSEAGSMLVIDLLNELGVGIEAGVWTVDDARLLIDSGLDAACRRVLVEVDAVGDPDEAVHLAASVDTILDDGLSEAPRLHHGAGIATWAVLAAAMEVGHDVRVGLEDTLVLADGSSAQSNEVLTRAASELARLARRSVESVEGEPPITDAQWEKELG